MVDEAPLKQTDEGQIAEGEGWFVLNARDAVWIDRGDRGMLCDFEHQNDFPQMGVHIYVLWPKQPMSMYHWEADQEDFLVLSGEALLIVEGEERPLRAWDFVHTPAKVEHTIVGAGEGPCVIVAAGARVDSVGPNWGAYPVNEAASRHNAGVDEETTDSEKAYARFPRRGPRRYQEGWLP